MKLRRKAQPKLEPDPHELIVEQTRDIAWRIRQGMDSVEEMTMLSELSELPLGDVQALLEDARRRSDSVGSP